MKATTVDGIKYYGNTLLVEAELPKEKDIQAEVESGINICLHKLKTSKAPHNKILFGNVTVNDLKKVFTSARDAVSYMKFEQGEDCFK